MRTEKEWNEKWKNEFRQKTFSPRLIRDLEQFNPTEEIENLLQTKKEGIYLYGTTGIGKTVLAAMLLEHLRKQCYLKSLSITSSWGCFITVFNLLQEIKETFDAPASSGMSIDVIEKYIMFNYLVLDDLGAEKTTDWSFEILSHIINERYENLKFTIFTSNWNLEQLADKFEDDRISSRIYRMCSIYAMEDLNRRLRG